MRIAALYDIHGNLPALEAVLEEIRGEAVDQLVVGGDVFPGPMAGESLACLLALDDIPIRFIRGNCDREVLALAAGAPTDSLPEQHRATIGWAAGRLDPEQRGVMETWPESVRVHIDGLGDTLFCHATPRNDTDIFTRLTPEDRLVPLFGELSASLVVCGHTHMQFDRMVAGVRVVNAGSVGMPFGEPGAYWLMLSGAGPQLRRTPYDFDVAAERIRATDYPQADGFAENNVLRLPSEQSMLELFGRAEFQ